VRRNDKAQTVPLACLPTKEYPRKIKIQNAVHGRAEGEGEMNERHLIDPTAELPDDTPIENIRFATRLRNALAVEGLKTVGEVRETADETLLSCSRSYYRYTGAAAAVFLDDYSEPGGPQDAMFCGLFSEACGSQNNSGA
jgi:hypothetical protein